MIDYLNIKNHKFNLSTFIPTLNQEEVEALPLAHTITTSKKYSNKLLINSGIKKSCSNKQTLNILKTKRK